MSTKTPTRPPTGGFKFQRGMGNGCYLEPPGHPSYYTRAVYNARGNSLDYDGAPSYKLDARELDEDGARYDLRGPGWVQSLDECGEFFRLLPEDHDRTRAWIKHVYQHLGRCYEHPTKGPREIMVWPDSIGASLALIDAGIFEPKLGDCSAECYETKAAKYKKAHDEKTAEFTRWCTPERHKAVQFVRRYYPKHAPRLDLIETPPTLRGSWYSTTCEWPAADACPGDTHVDLKHIPGCWCQWCGRE